MKKPNLLEITALIFYAIIIFLITRYFGLLPQSIVSAEALLNTSLGLAVILLLAVGILKLTIGIVKSDDGRLLVSLLLGILILLNLILVMSLPPEARRGLFIIDPKGQPIQSGSIISSDTIYVAYHAAAGDVFMYGVDYGYGSVSCPMRSTWREGEDEVGDVTLARIKLGEGQMKFIACLDSYAKKAHYILEGESEKLRDGYRITITYFDVSPLGGEPWTFLSTIFAAIMLLLEIYKLWRKKSRLFD